MGIHPAPYRATPTGGELGGEKTLKESIDDAIEVVPKADFYRCHGLYDSHWMQKEMKDRGFKFCSNRCEWMEYGARPRRNAVGMWDIPIWWEDSIEFRGWNTDDTKTPWKGNEYFTERAIDNTERGQDTTAAASGDKPTPTLH